MRSRSAITAIDLETLNTTTVISGLSGAAMDIDTSENKLYFQDGNQISRLSLEDDICVKVIVKNASAYDLAIDWIGGRMYWTANTKKQIFVANLDGKNRRMLANTTGKPYGIAFDALRRYVI